MTLRPRFLATSAKAYQHTTYIGTPTLTWRTGLAT